jgi:hypothetical protein
VRLGRLEFQLASYAGGVTAWRRPRDGAVLALAEDGVRVDAGGLRLSHDAPPKEGWTAHLLETPDTVVGSPIDPVGRIWPPSVRLDRREWTPCLRGGDLVLHLHIPAGGGMTWDACVDSFRRALDFFPRHHADRPFVAATLGTWFMDPRLAEILPPAANPLRLQRASYLFPTPPAPGGLWFVFFTPTSDPSSLPRDTSLRRALAEFLDRGGKWNGGGAFVLREHMPNLREGCYRAGFASLCAEMGFGRTSPCLGQT